MEGFLVVPFAGMPGEDIEDTISSVEIAYAARGLDAMLNEDLRSKAMSLMLRNAMQDPHRDEDGPKSFVSDLDKTTLNDFNLLSAKLKERFPVIKRERRRSRLQFFEEVTTLEQQPTETVQDYVKRARRLASGVEAYDQEALNIKFIQGLRNAGLRISVRTLVATKGDAATIPFETVAEAVLHLADEVMLDNTPALAPKRSKRLPSKAKNVQVTQLADTLTTHPPFRPTTPRSMAASIRSSSTRSLASVAADGSKLRGLTGHNLSLAQLILIVAPSFILFGYNQAGVGGLLSLNDWTKTFPEIDTTHTTGAVKAHNATIQGTVVAVFVLGALVGAFSCMYTGDYFGRRKNIFAAAVFTLIGEAVCCSSFHLAQFVVGRTIIGLGIGILSATVPVWQAECSSAANRGKHVVLDGLFITFGYTLEAWINLGFFQIKTGSLSWRIPLAIPCLFSIVLMASIFFMPESPRWLILVGRVEEGRRNLSALKGLPLHHRLVSAEVEGIQYSLEESSAKPASMMDIFSDKTDDKLFYRFCLCILLQFYQQMSGSNLISVYAPVIFQQNLQLDSQLTRILTGGALTWKFLSSFIAFFTIDRYGRRALFMFSGFGMGSCMLALTICTSFPKTNKPASIAGVFFIYMFNFFVPIGFLGANFLYCAEVAPSRLRVSMAAISTANHWLWNFVIVMITPVAINSLGFKYFIIFAVISYGIPASVYFFFPETMGQSLEQINQVFRNNKTPRAIVSAARLNSKAGGVVESEDTDRDMEKEMDSTRIENGKQ